MEDNPYVLKRGRKTGTTKTTDAARVFANVLKEIRLAKNISQEQLAFDADIHRTYVSALERGTKQPSLGTILSIADALGEPAHELVRRVEKIIEKRK